jgi:hypothetical protein
MLLLGVEGLRADFQLVEGEGKKPDNIPLGNVNMFVL